MESSASGLCWLPPGSPSYQPLPLQNVRVEATLYDLCAEVKIHQTYINNLHSGGFTPPRLPLHSAPSSHLECIYVFPLDDDSAVFSFDAELDGVIVKGGIREKLQAQAEYASALASNRAAMLLEQSSDIIFQCKVGNLKYGSVCTITLTYLTLLEQEGRHNRLTLPMVIAPKYTPSYAGPTPPDPWTEPLQHNAIHKGYQCENCLCSPIIGTRHHCEECAYDLCHGCYMRHDVEHHMHTHTGEIPPAVPTIVQSKMTDLIIKLNITMPSPIVSILCPSHPGETKITQSNDPSNHATVFFHSVSTCSLSKDFILLVEQQRCFEPRILCELDVTHHTAAVSLAFIPPPVDMLSASQIQCELIFLIDCSGSMRGSSIACVRECMQLLLRSLPVHSYFNIITFGSTWHSLFHQSQPYDDKSLAAASHHVSGLAGNLGGTEIYPPLLHALTSKALPTHPRQVFLLTDGQVANVKQLVQLTAQHAVSTRLFTFGIGNSVDRLLCKKLAQAGRGKCEFVIAEEGRGSTMREKVVRQVARAMQPVLTDVTVDWRQLKEPKACEGNDEKLQGNRETCAPDLSIPNASFLVQCPSVAPAIFMSSRYMLHAMNVSLPDYVWQQAKEGHKVDFSCEIAITARSNNHLEEGQMRHSVVLTGEQITLAGVIHTLAAKERIRELEEKVEACSGEERKRLEDEILKLAIKYTLSSSRTSFVIVYNAGTDEETAEEMAHPFEFSGFVDCLPQARNMVSFRACSLKASMVSVGARSPTASMVSFGAPVLEASVFAAGEQSRGGSIWKAVKDGNKRLSSYARHSAGTESMVSFGSAAVHGAEAVPEADMVIEQSGAVGQSASLFQFENAMGGELGVIFERRARHQKAQSTKAEFADSMRSSSISQDTQQKGLKRDVFEELIMLQSANGSWQVTPALIDVTNSIAPTLTMKSLEAIGKEHAVDVVAVAVLLALHLLETHFQHRQAEWEMIATKALFFLSENCKVSTSMQQKIKDSLAKLL